MEKRYCLKQPYKLSFATLKYFDSIQFKVLFSDGLNATSEVVPLPGYSDESKQYICDQLKRIIYRSLNHDIDSVRSHLAGEIKLHPFTSSVLLNAIDLRDFKLSLEDEIAAEVPLVQGLSLNGEHLTVSSAGTYKIKLTRNYREDLKRLSFLKVDNEQVRLRLDANQGYTLPAARSFTQLFSELPIARYTDYIEQPLSKKAWDDTEELMKSSPIPIMLDESIITDEDMHRACDIGIPFIKLKSFKQGGIKELIHQIELAHSLSLKIVLGNGVATKLSNDIENSVYIKFQEYIYGASEANGFKRISDDF